MLILGFHSTSSFAGGSPPNERRARAGLIHAQGAQVSTSWTILITRAV